MIEDFKKAIEEGHIVKGKSFDINKEKLIQVVEEVFGALSTGKKVLIFGNGGSAADAQHIAAEFVIRLNIDRKAYPVIALTTDTSIITACGNDLGFEKVFARQIEALGSKGDIAIALSTSGNSPNVVIGVHEAKRKNMSVITFTGDSEGKIEDETDILIKIKSKNSMRIQETYMTFLHTICDIVEKRLAGRN